MTSPRSTCLAVAQDGQDLPAADRGGVGVRGAGGHDDAVLVGLIDLDRPGQLRRQLHLRQRPQGRVSREDRCRWTASRRIRGVFTTFTAMCGSGCRTAGTAATTVRRRMARLGQLEIVVAVWSWAVPGSTIRGASAPRAAAGTPPTTGAAVWASGWPERYRLPLFTSPVLKVW